MASVPVQICRVGELERVRQSRTRPSAIDARARSISRLLARRGRRSGHVRTAPAYRPTAGQRRLTTPEETSYIEATILIFPSASSWARRALRWRTFWADFSAWVRATASTNSAFFDVRAPSYAVWSIAALKRASNKVRLPSTTLSIAPLIAPQDV